MSQGYVYYGDGSSIPARLLPPRPVRGKPHFHDRSQNGVSILVHRTKDDDVTLYAECECLGDPERVAHTHRECPLFKAALATLFASE